MEEPKIKIKNPEHGADIHMFHINTGDKNFNVNLNVGDSCYLPFSAAKQLIEVFHFLQLDDGVDIGEMEAGETEFGPVTVEVIPGEKEENQAESKEENPVEEEAKENIVEVEEEVVEKVEEKEKENKDKSPYEETEEFECGTCQRVFASKIALIGHMRSHEPKKNK